MQKAAGNPAARAKSSFGGSLKQDGGDDQDLAGKGDDARHAGLNDTHFNFLGYGERTSSRSPRGVRRAFSQLQR
jgi:hypothetical protein